MTAGDKRQHILQAAERLFTNGRFHEITLEEVAQAAKVGKGTIYQYFDDKEDLFFQVVTSGVDELCALLHRRVRSDAHFEEQLLDACIQTSTFFDRRRQLFCMMQAEDARMGRARANMRDRWIEKRKRLVEAVTAIIRKGVAEGKVRSDIPAEILAEFLLGMVRTRARELRDAPEAIGRHELLIDLFCNGASASSARALV